MPVLSFDSNRRSAARRSRGGAIVVGLVNNMPDAALCSTERQFRELLAAAAGDRRVELRVFSFPGLSRSDKGRQYVQENHQDIAALWRSDIDGLVVTGTEPRARDLASEPYWPALSRLVDWAAAHTRSTIWSCLAAHAAVYCLDGIERRPFADKLSGVFECAKADEDRLLDGVPARWCTPHSRWNELPEEALQAKGYRILARGPASGADMFVKQQGSLFVFLQGHPEYDPGALLREYRRDVGRYLAAEREGYPALPSGYFDAPAVAVLCEFRERAMRRRDPALLAEFPITAAQQGLTGPWRPMAMRLYANWLSSLADARAVADGRAATLRACDLAPPLAAHG